MQATAGQILVNSQLPEDLRDYARVLDKKGIESLLQEVARRYPEKYSEIASNISTIGWKASQASGGMSFGLRHLRKSPVAKARLDQIRQDLSQILNDDNLTDRQREEAIVLSAGKHQQPLIDEIYREGRENKHPLAMQVLSGNRGKPMNLSSLLGSDLLYEDSRNEVIPIPILNSYSDGLTPAEYWSGTYGARRGVLAAKMGTADGGYLSKQLARAAHRLIIVGVDSEEYDPENPRGYLVNSQDSDNEGALLAADIGPFKRNTPITPDLMKHLKRLGIEKMLIRSPMVGGSPDGGLYARDVGIRETGNLPGVGEFVGKQATQAISEPVTQSLLSAKHSGGVAGQEKTVGGFQAIDQMIQVPSVMAHGATHSEVDGYVDSIEENPAGGWNVRIGTEEHYVPVERQIKVKKGELVEAGDVITDGLPSPAKIVEHKGIGEGRRYFVDQFSDVLKASGTSAHRRNLELLSRALINHVKIDREYDEYNPEDVVSYHEIESKYLPRGDSERRSVKQSIGQYLEKPVLHYSIGTKIRPSVAKTLRDFGVNSIVTHAEPPFFHPKMVRGAEQLRHDPDFMTQLYGGWQEKSLLSSTHRGATSDPLGTSFVPALAKGLEFGKTPGAKVRKPLSGESAELPDLVGRADQLKQAMFRAKEALTGTSIPGTKSTPSISDPTMPKVNGGSIENPAGTNYKVSPGFSDNKAPSLSGGIQTQQNAIGGLSPSVTPATPGAIGSTPPSIEPAKPENLSNSGSGSNQIQMTMRVNRPSGPGGAEASNTVATPGETGQSGSQDWSRLLPLLAMLGQQGQQGLGSLLPLLMLLGGKGGNLLSGLFGGNGQGKIPYPYRPAMSSSNPSGYIRPEVEKVVNQPDPLHSATDYRDDAAFHLGLHGLGTTAPILAQRASNLASQAVPSVVKNTTSKALSSTMSLAPNWLKNTAGYVVKPLVSTAGYAGKSLFPGPSAAPAGRSALGRFMLGGKFLPGLLPLQGSMTAWNAGSNVLDRHWDERPSDARAQDFTTDLAEQGVVGQAFAGMGQPVDAVESISRGSGELINRGIEMATGADSDFNQRSSNIHKNLASQFNVGWNPGSYLISGAMAANTGQPTGPLTPKENSRWNQMDDSNTQRLRELQTSGQAADSDVTSARSVADEMTRLKQLANTRPAEYRRQLGVNLQGTQSTLKDLQREIKDPDLPVNERDRIQDLLRHNNYRLQMLSGLGGNTE